MKAETSVHSEEYLVTDKEKSKQKKIALHFKKLELINEIKSRIKNIYENTEPEEILIYGLTIFFFEKEDRIKKGIIYINEKEENSLIFLDLKTKLTVRIQLSKLADINFGKNSGNFKVCENRIKKFDELRCLTMHMKDKTKFYDLVFNTKEDLDLFCLGIAYVLEKNINDAKNLKRDIISLKQIWKQYVSDEDKKHLNFQQFSKFLRTICFKWKKKTDEQIFMEIDVKKQGKINFKDFISFYEFLVTGEEFTEIFQKYSSDEEKKYITIRGLMDFMEKEQHLKVSMQDIFNILHKFSKKGKKILESTGLINSIREGVIDAEEYININNLNQNKNNENLNNEEANGLNREISKIHTNSNNLNNNKNNNFVNNNSNPELNSNLKHLNAKDYLNQKTQNYITNINNKNDSKVNLNINIKNEGKEDKNYANNQNKNYLNELNYKTSSFLNNNISKANSNKYQNNFNNNPKSNLSNNLNSIQRQGTNNLNSNNKNNLEHESLQAIYDNYSFGKNNILDEIKEGKNEDLYSAFCLSFREFVNFLIDKSYNSIYNHDLFSLHQNMNMPINDYFIYSSHNTYLEGNQMIGNSSIDMYVNCLKNGCRLVELDCWDGKSGPIITHWHFPVNKLDLKEVLMIIKDIAFKKSPYPVIFSIENHCNNTSQEMMAQYFLDVIGKENLYVIDTENPPLAYPSPNDLQRKFIIKCKRKRILGKKEDIKKLIENNMLGSNNNNFNMTNPHSNSFPKNSNSNLAQPNNLIISQNNNNNLHNNPLIGASNNFVNANLNNNSGDNNLKQQQESNSYFCNLEADSAHVNQTNNCYDNNNDKIIANNIACYPYQEKINQQVIESLKNTNNLNNNLSCNDNFNSDLLNKINNKDNDIVYLNNTAKNCNIDNMINYSYSNANNDKNQNIEEENKDAKILNNLQSQNCFIVSNNYNINNIEENKKNILRMVQKEEIIEEVNSVNSLKNTSYNEGQIENLLDSSNENIEILTDRYHTRETTLITCINENKYPNREKFYNQKIKNIYENKKIYNPISKINKIESVQNLRKLPNMSPLDKGTNISNLEDNLINSKIHSYIEVNKLDINNFKELDEEVDAESKILKMKSKFDLKKKENLQNYQTEKEKNVCKDNNKLLPNFDDDLALINKNFSLSSTDFTSKRNYIKNKLDSDINNKNNLNNYQNKNEEDNLNNQYLNSKIGNESLKLNEAKKNNQSCISQKIYNDQAMLKKHENYLLKALGWNEKIQLANEEIKKVLKSKKIKDVESSNLQSNLIDNNPIQTSKEKNLININENNQKEDYLNINTYESNQNNNNEYDTTARAKCNSVKANKIEKGNLKYITNTGILNSANNENNYDNEINFKRKLSDNNANYKDDIAVKIKYLAENKELKFKHLNIEIKDPPINPNNFDNENNPNGFTHSNFYEVYKIKTKKKKKKNVINMSLESEVSDPLNEMQISQPTNSNKVFKKLKVKYLINDNFKTSNNNNIDEKTNLIETNNINNLNLLNTNNNNLNNANYNAIDYPNLKAEGESNINMKTILAANNNHLNNNVNNNDFEVLTRMHEIRTIDELKPSTIKIKTINKLAAIVGMIGVKYKQSDFDGGLYLPWECVSISEPDFNKYIVNIEERIKLIKFCQKAFIKTYPDVVKRTNSSNHDPIVCWASGVQIVALNLQKTDDDMILINKIFFKLNGGSKSGYILKPELLRNPYCDEFVKRMCTKVAFKIKFKVLSGFHLHLCFPEKTKITGLYVEVSLRSAYNDNDNNKKLVTNTIENNYLHPIWVSSSVHFEVYDPDLSFIMIKVFSKKKTVIARSVIPVKFMNLGIRVVDLYDNYCSKFENSFLIVKCNRILVDK